VTCARAAVEVALDARGRETSETLALVDRETAAELCRGGDDGFLLVFNLAED
jgi:hypothetical protein